MAASKEDIVRVVDDFVNSIGAWPKFKAHVEKQGYTLRELGFTDDDDDEKNPNNEGE